VIAPDTVASSRGADRRAELGRGLIWFSVAFGLIVDSFLFHRSSWFVGDLAYHRGVALTMQAGHLQGWGPFRGLPSYYGGLYPLVMAGLSRATGWSFDAILSVVSWFGGVLWPLAVWRLGRRLWPGDLLTQGCAVFLATVAGPFTAEARLLWVDSLLPAGHNTWPLFPRDVALILFVAALSLALSPRRVARTLGAGLVLGVGLCVQAQFGVVACVVAGAALVWKEWGGPFRVLVADVLALELTAILVSAWWWLPRLRLALRTWPLLLASATNRRLDVGPWVYLRGFGLCGLLVVAGVVVMLRRRAELSRLDGFLLLWVGGGVAIALASSLMGDTGFSTGRRMWFLASLPMVLVAAYALGVFARHLPLLVVLVALLVGAVLPGAFTTYRARQRADAIYQSGRYADQRYQGWGPTFAALTAASRKDSSYMVIAPDNDASATWLFSGAPVFSLLPPGSVKFGFDPDKVTPYRYLDRVRMEDDAFRAGLPGICRLATRVDARGVVLRALGTMVATHDVRPAAHFRAGPDRRWDLPLNRPLANGYVYRDRGNYDMLVIPPGTPYALGWTGHQIRVVDVDVFVGNRGAVPDLRLSTSAGPVVPSVSGGGTRRRLHFEVPGPIDGSALVATQKVTLLRVLGYEDVPGAPATGPTVLWTRAQLCRAAG
jgi:hypothetical protein